MVISAWEVRDRMHRLSVEHSLRNALQAATALHEQNVDVAHLVLSIAETVVDPKHKAMLLSGAARVLTEAGLNEEALGLMLAALDVSRLAGRDTVMEVLADGTMALAAVDDGELLGQACRELEEIDGWFGA
jgi:hypothetical protein